MLGIAKISEKNNGLINRLDVKSLKGKICYGIMTALLVGFAVLSLFPLIWAVLSGFKESQEFNMIPPTLFPKSIDLQKVTELFSVYHIQNYALNSVIVIFGSLLVEISFTAMAGYVLSRLKPIGSKLLFTAILWTIMMPQTTSLVPLFMTFIDLPFLHINLMNTYVPMWLIAGANAFHIIMFKDFFDKIPISYFESAQIDGCGNIGMFIKIVLPLSKPIIATISVFVIMASWNEFMWPFLLLRNKELFTIGLALYKLKENLSAPQTLMFSALMMLPMIIVYFTAQRYVMDNSISEGEKG